MPPLKLDLQAFSDAEYLESVEVTLDGSPQPWAGWTDFDLLFVDNVFATVALFAGTVTQPADGILQLQIAMADLAACFPPGEAQASRRYPYVLRAKPTGTYRIRLMYGTLALQKGLL